MLRVASIITLMLLGMAAGCRTVPPPYAAADRAGFLDARTQVIREDVQLSQVDEVFHPVMLVQLETNDTDRPSARSELLPLATPETLTVEPLSLVDLERRAIEYNPVMAAAAARIDAARGRQFQVGRFPNPVVGYHATEIGNRGTAGQQGGFVSQRFITGGKLHLDQAIVGKEIDEAHFRFHAQELRVLSDVRIRFYEALVTQRRLELTQELAGIGDDLVAATEKLLKARLGTQNDLLQAEIRAEEARILLDNARNQNMEAWRRLAAVVGTPSLPLTPLIGELSAELSPLDWNEASSNVLAGNPALDAARARVERAGLTIARARKEPIPNVDLSVSVRHHNVIRNDVANIQVGMPIPIFDKNRGNIRSAEADWIAANNDVRRLELDLQDRLAVAFRQYENARQQTVRYRERMVPKAKQSLELVRGGYDAGQVEYLTLLTAQQTYVKVNLAYLDALQELRAAEASMDGQLLSGSLTVEGSRQ